VAASKFTPGRTAQIVASVTHGAGLRDAARESGISLDTLKAWVTRGNREGKGEHTDFAAALTKVRDGRDDDGPMSAAEFREHLDRAVRSGSVQAMKLLAEILGRESAEPEPAPDSNIARLSERRRSA
jgi:hypothetical protein